MGRRPQGEKIMGVYDSFYDQEGKEHQTKTGPCCMLEYRVGDKVDEEFPSIAVIESHNGYIVIYDHTFLGIGSNQDEAKEILERFIVNKHNHE